VSKSAALTRNLEDRPYLIPIAHAEGNYYCTEDVMKELEDNDQILFKYCDEKGDFSADANPNGSLNHIAGITNTQKNVFGLMPHPERASDEMLGNVDGKRILETLISA
ncbi:MAG: phosphoribosylformylglycinamidine synthase subunit PurQ, partial [Bacteroidota bacterium]